MRDARTVLNGVFWVEMDEDTRSVIMADPIQDKFYPFKPENEQEARDALETASANLRAAALSFYGDEPHDTVISILDLMEKQRLALEP